MEILVNLVADLAETLMPLILDLEKKYLFYKKDKKFNEEFPNYPRII